jgi:hypothetical protein
VPGHHKTTHYQPTTQAQMPKATAAHQAIARSQHAMAQQQQQQQAMNRQMQDVQRQQADEQRKHEAERKEQDRKKELEACLSLDTNCSYGTSNKCEPTPYGDEWGERGQFRRAIEIFKMCNDEPWEKSCLPKVLATLPDLKVIVARLKKLDKREHALPHEYREQCPAWESDLGNSEHIAQVRFWCSNTKKDCMPTLEVAVRELENAFRVDECVYRQEFHAYRDDLKKKHDDECHKKFGN